MTNMSRGALYVYLAFLLSLPLNTYWMRLKMLKRWLKISSFSEQGTPSKLIGESQNQFIGSFAVGFFAHSTIYVTSLYVTSLYDACTKPRKKRSPRNLASIIQAPRCGATVCRTRLRLGAGWGSHCGGNYVCTQILGACISSYLRSHPGN